MSTVARGSQNMATVAGRFMKHIVSKKQRFVKVGRQLSSVFDVFSVDSLCVVGLSIDAARLGGQKHLVGSITSPELGRTAWLPPQVCGG